MKSTKTIFNLPTIIVSITIFILLAFVTVDYTIIQPKLNKEITETIDRYKQIKFKIDVKLPEIDSTLNIHSNQIADQKTQLDEINSILEGLQLK